MYRQIHLIGCHLVSPRLHGNTVLSFAEVPSTASEIFELQPASTPHKPMNLNGLLDGCAYSSFHARPRCSFVDTAATAL
jgi:hypothetical protein